MKKELPYDNTNPLDIESYAKKLIGHNFLEVLKNNLELSHDDFASYSNSLRKGGLGNLLEEQYFFYDANNDSEPDFVEAGVELKVTPYEKKKNGELRAGERLVLTMISYDKPIDDKFEESHLWYKCKLLLLIYYLRDKNLGNNLLYPIDYVTLFTPPIEDLSIIKNDFKIITEKIKSGRAHELSEGDTMYLGACTKGSTAEKSTVSQYYNPDIKARKRAFCYKNSYMSYILNRYVIPEKITYEPIIKDLQVLDKMTFEEFICSLINKNIGKSDYELCKEYDRKYNNNKSQWIDLAFKMLGVRSNKAEEFEKANIKVKAIRIEKSGKIKESSPLPQIKLSNFINEEWEESTLYEYFTNTKFLFVVFKKVEDFYILRGCHIWNMNMIDLKVVEEGWKKIKAIVSNGIVLEPKETKKGIIIRNNLPSKKDNKIIHIRPHSQKRFYVLEDGTTIGDGSYSDAEELPDGRWMQKQSFWINNSYILSQLPNCLK